MQILPLQTCLNERSQRNNNLLVTRASTPPTGCEREAFLAKVADSLAALVPTQRAQHDRWGCGCGCGAFSLTHLVHHRSVQCNLTTFFSSLAVGCTQYLWRKYLDHVGVFSSRFIRITFWTSFFFRIFCFVLRGNRCMCQADLLCCTVRFRPASPPNPFPSHVDLRTSSQQPVSWTGVVSFSSNPTTKARL